MKEFNLTYYCFKEKMLWKFITMIKTKKGYELFKGSWWIKRDNDNDINFDNYNNNGIIVGDKGTKINYTIDYKFNKLYINSDKIKE